MVEVLVDGRLERVKVKAKNLRLDARAEPEPEEVEEISAPVPAQARASSPIHALVADMQRLQQESDVPTPPGAGSGPPRRLGAGTADAHGNAPPWIYEALARPEPRGQVRVDKSGTVALPREVTHGVDGKEFPQLDGPLAGVPARFFQTRSDGSITAVFVMPFLNMPLGSIDLMM